MGVTLPGTGLACDETRAVEFCFVSHAGIRTAARKVLATVETLALGDPARPGAGVITPTLGEPFSLGEHTLTLLPSGYLPGAAHLLVERAGHRTLYVSRLPRMPVIGPACDRLVLNPGLADAGADVDRVADLVAWIEAGPDPVILVESPVMLAHVARVLAGESITLLGPPAVAARLALLDLPPGTRQVQVVPLARRGESRPRLPRPARPALVFDPVACARPRVGVDLEASFTLGHAGGTRSYARLVTSTDAGEVQVFEDLADLPRAVDDPGIRWLAPEEQISLGSGPSSPGPRGPGDEE